MIRALALAACSLPAGAQWSTMPPECAGQCWPEDNKHPLARCPPQVLDDVVTPEKADLLIRAAEAHATVYGWTTQRHAAYPTTDLPWEVLSGEAQTVIGEAWKAMRENVFSRCGISSDAALTPNDIFLVKYTPEGQPGLHRHRDGSFASFNLMLSDPADYDGGGTRMWNTADVTANRTLYWSAATKGARDSFRAEHGEQAELPPHLLRPHGGWDIYHPRPDELMPEHAVVHRLKKGQMLVGGGFNAHEGLPVTRGTRYIVAGFVGMNRHCCSLKYAGWRGIFGILRVYTMAGMDPNFGRDDIPLHDWELYEEGKLWVKIGLTRSVVVVVALVVLRAMFPKAAAAPGEAYRRWLRWRKRRSLLPSKSYD